MDHLQPPQRAELRERLELERRQLLARTVSEHAEAEADGELGDVLDKASEEARRTTANRRRRHHDARLVQVEAALRRMDEGTYGICEETDEPIPYARLAAEPTTRYTVEALELIEQERARDDNRAIEPDEADAY